MAALGIPAGVKLIAGLVHLIPKFNAGVTGAGGTPHATAAEGGDNAGHSGDSIADALKDFGDALDKSSDLAKTIGEFMQRADEAKQKAAESQIQIQQATAELAAANLRYQIAVQNQANHQTQIDRLQQQLDFYQNRFSNADLYDWMVGQLADTYFQSYQLAYQLCKQVERCYQYELGIPDSSFIQFGYWDSLRKGLLAGETMNHDLRRLQASYLEKNSRRFEISRYISLAAIDLVRPLVKAAGLSLTVDVPESLFDHDYPGHYNRHLVRVSVTVAYPNPGKFDNVKATLTLANNKVRTSADLTGGYAEAPPGGDQRFAYNYAAVPLKIVLGNAQDDPGLFLTSITDNLSDQRYLPFEAGGAISSWHFEMPAASNEIAVANVTDVILHLYYTALDGGDAFKQAVQNG